MKPMKGRLEFIPPDKLQEAKALAPARPGVSFEERQGVWVHSFICNLCGLHFNVYSWKPNRHRTDKVTCPECGQRDGKFLHYRACLSRGKNLSQGEGREIWNHCPYPGSELMDDSTLSGRLPTELDPSS